MATLFQHRILIVVPAARRAAFVTWYQANIDPAETLNVELTAGGGADNAAPTHYWINTALRMADLKKIMQRLCNLASITPPPTWDTMTRGQRKQWFGDQRAAIQAATGIRVHCADNDGAWDDPEGPLGALTLKRRRAAGV